MRSSPETTTDAAAAEDAGNTTAEAARRRPPGAGGEAESPSGGSKTLGANLRAIRRSRNLSLNDVADATGISSSFLSLVETGGSDITIGRLTRLIEFFGISITDLVPAATRKDPDIVRESERIQLRSPVEGLEIFLLTPDTRRAMMAMLLELEPGAGRAEYGNHPGEEFVYVVKGELELEIKDRGKRRLLAGDSAYYPGDTPHLFRNASTVEPLQILCVDTPPTF
jgi:transcriptional regulator with XRE-family HTH domain